MPKKQRIDNILSNLGYGSRSELKKLCKNGLVKVNGKVINNPGVQVDVENDEILFDGEKVVYKEFIYLMLNKPDGYISATFDKRDPIVLDLIDKEALIFEPFPVGRLDKDTEGLLLITNDGELAHNLLSPRKHVSKTYYAECTGIINTDKLTRLEQGLDIGDTELTLPAKAELISQSDDAYAVKLTIVEGRFHQVKRMIAAIGGSVTYLKRISMGSLVLDENLPKGKYRLLTENEISGLKSHALKEEV